MRAPWPWAHRAAAETPYPNTLARERVTQPHRAERARSRRRSTERMGQIPTKTTNDNAATTATPAASRATRDTRAEIAAALKSSAAAIGRLLGGDDKLADRFCRAALAHWSTTANLSEKDRKRLEGVNANSYAAACLSAALDRLTPDGRDGWIIVRDNGTAAWSISWRGMMRRFRRAVKAEGGDVRQCCAEIVYQQEIDRGGFDVDLFERRVTHRPWFLLKPKIEIEPMWEDVALVYAAATIVAPNGVESREFRILTIAEINTRARMSGDPKSAEWSAAWDAWPRPMSKKSAWRSLLDLVPTPDEVWEAVERGSGLAAADVEGLRALPATPAAALAGRVRSIGSTLDATAREADAPADPNDPHGAHARERGEADAAARAVKQGDA